MESTDRFILSYMLNDYSVGIYSANYKLGILGLLIVMAFNMGWTPYFLKKRSERDSNLEFSTIATLFLGLHGILGIIMTFGLPWLTQINFFGHTIIHSRFFEGLYIIPIILMSYYFFGMYVLLLPKIYNSESTHLIPRFRFVGALTNIVLNILLIPDYGLIGCSIANMFVMIFWNISFVIIIKNKLGFNTTIFARITN